MNDRFTQLAFSSAGWSEDQDTRVEPRIEPRVTRAQTWNEDVHRIGRTGRVGNQSRATSIGPPSDKGQQDCPSQEKDSGQIQWSSALKEEAFSWFKLQKNQVFLCLT